MSEVLLNSLQNDLSLPLAETLDKPLLGIFVVLSIITSAFAATSWHDVASRVSTALRYWNEVVLRHGMPKPSRSAAIGAAIAKIRQAIMPFSNSKITDLTTLSSTASMVSVRAITIRSFSYLIGMSHLPTARITNGFTAMSIIPAFSFCIYFLWVLFNPTVFNRFGFSWVVMVPLKFVAMATALTVSTKTVGATICDGKVFTCSGKVPKTLFAVFKRAGDIQHSAFTSRCLPDVLSADGGKNRFSGINLADLFIIPLAKVKN